MLDDFTGGCMYGGIKETSGRVSRQPPDYQKNTPKYSVMARYQALV